MQRYWILVIVYFLFFSWQVTLQLSHWTWLLDASLPGVLGPIGEWLSHAEALLGTEVKLYGKNDEVGLWLSVHPGKVSVLNTYIFFLEQHYVLDHADFLTVLDFIAVFHVHQIATLLSQKIEEHKTFFSKLPSIVSSFEAVKTSKDAASIPKQQLEGIEQRLSTIAPRAARRKIKLKYLEHRVSL